MSKVKVAKEAQGYEEKPRNCGNCQQLQFTMELPAWMRGDPRYDNELGLKRHGRETNLRCGIGGFAVKKTASCREWTARAIPMAAAEE